MDKPKFKIEDLKMFVEGKLGERVVRFDLITDCSRPENFAVATESGKRMLVKCGDQAPNGKPDYFGHFVRHLEELKGTRAIQLIHGPYKFGQYSVIMISWCEGCRVMPDRLTAEQEKELIKAYGEFSSAMQRCTQVLPPRDNVEVREAAMRFLTGPFCAKLREFVERELPNDALKYDAGKLKVIHGDLHHGNFYFDGDVMTGFMDLEDFRYGYPADDWTRYVICAAEHLKWFDLAGRRRLVALFGRLLPLAPSDEWREAVGGLLVRKIFRRFNERKGTKLWLAANLQFRLGIYKKMFEKISEYSARTQSTQHKG